MGAESVQRYSDGVDTDGEPDPAATPLDVGASVDVGASPALNRVVVDEAPDAMIVTGSDGRIVLGNRRAREMFGYDAATLLGLGIDDLLPESLRATHARHRGRYARHPRAREMGSGLELLGLRADGGELPVEVSLSPVTVDGEHFVVAAVRDLAERRAAEASLNATRDRLALTAERERIGRDLHDSVIQRLYGAGLAMQAALDADPARLRTAVGRAVDEIDDTIAEIRTVIHDLLRDVGEPDRLADRLQQVVDAQAAALGIDVRLNLVGEVGSQPSEPVADAAVAVVREGIANAHRHGRATRVGVDLEIDGDGLRLTVHDDGSGFDPDDALDAPGYGLKNLRARAAEFDGTFDIRSEPGAGASLIWTIPQS